MASTLRSFVVVVDRVSSRLLGRDGSVRNARVLLDDQRRSYEQIEVLRRRLVPVERGEIGRARRDAHRLDVPNTPPSLDAVLYWVIKGVLTPVLRGLYRIRLEGREHVPEHGPVILAMNHRSFMDSIFLPLVIRRRVTFVAKAEYFDDKRTAWFFRGVGQIPIRREGGSASERALASATEVLESGGVFGIYPEGTRTRDGYLHRGHTGVARLALRTGAPIVPVGMIGTDEIQPTDKKMPRVLQTLGIRFGTPISVDRYAGREHDRMVLRQITDELMFEIQQLCGYEYVDTYATKQAEDVPTDPVPLAVLEITAA